jgi:hypothetical protein
MIIKVTIVVLASVFGAGSWWRSPTVKMHQMVMFYSEVG